MEQSYALESGRKAERLTGRYEMIREGVCFAGGQSVTVILKS